jgi:hypothetical protein
MADTNKKEYGIRKPSDFNGDRKGIQKFMLNCRSYLQTNQHVYDTDESKVSFILSFMDDGEAGKWKENYLLSILDATGSLKFPKIEDFMTTLLKAFKPANQERNATHQIDTLRQGKKTAEEVITEFRLLSNQAGYTMTTSSDHNHLIGKLQKVLNTNLVRRILLLDDIPTTIDDWADKAIQIDSNYRHAQETLEILNEEKKYSKSSKTNTAKTTYSNNWRKKKEERDPDAMDVDAMTAGKRAYLMKKGACFICEEPGHRASEHDDHVKSQQKNKGKGKTPPKKDLKTIHALFEALSKGEKEELLAMSTKGTKKEEKEKEEETETDDEKDF